MQHHKHVAHRFFIGLSLNGLWINGRERRPKHEHVVREALAFGDLGLLDLEDHYLSTPKKVVALFRWGVAACGAYWILRSNDDVFLRLEPTMHLLSRHAPANVMMGLMIDGNSMHVPRPEHYNATKESLYLQTKAWAFTHSDYPSEALPTFAQGNAMVLSRDLAFEVAEVARRPWFRLMADDVMVALLTARFAPLRVVVAADYEFHGSYTTCHDAALWNFNIHPEHMYDLFHNTLFGRRPCEGIVRFCCG